MIPIKKINWDKFKAILEFAKTIPEHKLDMAVFREAGMSTHNPECNTVGCIIGHSTVLDPKLAKECTHSSEGIEFPIWFMRYAEYDSSDNDNALWDWCFHGDWATIDNTVEGAVKRMQYAYDNKAVPADHFQQLFGDAEYMFKQQT